MTTQTNSGGEWHSQLGTWLGTAALAFALYALLRDNPNTRSVSSAADSVEIAADIQLRDAVVKLQESMSQGGGQSGEDGSTARSWIYFQSAQALLRSNKGRPSLASCLVLANFCFAHADIEQGEQFLALADAKIKTEKSVVTQSLARAAIAHFLFEHAPKTSVEEGRKRFADAISGAKQVTGPAALFVQLSIRQEWALDEYAAGEETAGDEQLDAARQLLKQAVFTPRYAAQWEQTLETAVIQAKVQGGLL